MRFSGWTGVGAAEREFANARIVECGEMSLPNVEVDEANRRVVEQILQFGRPRQIELWLLRNGKNLTFIDSLE